MRTKSKVQSLKAKVRPAAPVRQRGDSPKANVRGAESKVQGPKPKAQRPRPAAVDYLPYFGRHFGAAPAGKRLFVQASTMVGGFESLPRLFQARVPASA